MRLIDADALQAEHIEAYGKRLLLIDTAPAAIILCQECIHFHPTFCAVWSRFGTVQTHPGGWCYKAERRPS